MGRQNGGMALPPLPQALPPLPPPPPAPPIRALVSVPNPCLALLLHHWRSLRLFSQRPLRGRFAIMLSCRLRSAAAAARAGAPRPGPRRDSGMDAERPVLRPPARPAVCIRAPASSGPPSLGRRAFLARAKTACACTRQRARAHTQRPASHLHTTTAACAHAVFLCRSGHDGQRRLHGGVLPRGGRLGLACAPSRHQRNGDHPRRRRGNGRLVVRPQLRVVLFSAPRECVSRFGWDWCAHASHGASTAAS